MQLVMHLAMHFADCKNEMYCGGYAFGYAFRFIFFVFDPTNFQESGKNKVFCVFSRGKITKRTTFAAHFLT